MAKYLKSFDDLKLEIRRFVTKTNDDTGESYIIDLIDDNERAAIDFSQRSRFGRNPFTNLCEYEKRKITETFVVHHANGQVSISTTTHTTMSFDEFMERFVTGVKQR